MTLPKGLNRRQKQRLTHRLDCIDAQIARWMASHGVTYLRASLGVVFLWFGGLKLFPGLSPAEDLVGRTFLALTAGLIEPTVSVPLLGVWETTIGICLITGRALRLSLVVFFLQMIGTATPLLLFPAETFASGPLVLTFEGQYIVKNIVFVSAAFVVAATVRGGKLKADRTGEYSRQALGLGDLDTMADPDEVIVEFELEPSGSYRRETGESSFKIRRKPCDPFDLAS